MKKLIIIICIVAVLFPTIGAFGQKITYDSREQVTDCLFKVRSGDFYGIIDVNDNVRVSVEYQDICFRDGKALLLKDDYLFGVVDSLGNFVEHAGKYKIHPDYPYVYDGYILVSAIDNALLGNKWGYIKEDGEPLRIKSKIKGVVHVGNHLPSLFDEIAPFVDGVACVYIRKSGWKHIDNEGYERYVLNKKIRSSFRSSVYKGETLVLTDDGLKLYQESPNAQAVVKHVILPSASYVGQVKDSVGHKLILTEGVLYLDTLMRVDKLVAKEDSIIFIERPKPVVIDTIPEPVAPIDTLSVSEDLHVSLKSRYSQANANGAAYVSVKIKNTAGEAFTDIGVKVNCNGAAKEWSGKVESGAELTISLSVPARFSSAEIRRNVAVTIQYKETETMVELPVTIKRYNPVRSR